MPAKALASQIKVMQRRLLSWFKSQGRDLPWRKTTDPYAIVVSEIMLQQTQVDRVIPKYQAFLKQFPTWQALAKAAPAQVITAWAGLGYNRRALGLHRLAQEVVGSADQAATGAGELPSDAASLEQMSGIGPYTARAVQAFAFRVPHAAPVDTNIERILRRVFNRYQANKQELSELAQKVSPRDSWSWNHAMMDLGATVCTARSPKCEECPLQTICAAYPCAGNEIKKRPQDKFEQSNRWYRGKILTHLGQVSTANIQEIATAINLTNHALLEHLLQQLLAEGFLTKKAKSYSLRQ